MQRKMKNQSSTYPVSPELILRYLAFKNKKEISLYDSTFPSQDNFCNDTSRFIAAQCSRRAGKSNGLALRFLRTLEKHPGALCLYIALTRESARNIMWPILQEMDEKYQIGCHFTESNLTMTHPNQSRLQLFGADMKNFIRRLKGIKTPGVAIDEAQDFGSHLQSLVDDVLTPTLTDYEDSWLAITGTPGPVPMGYFYDITFKLQYGFSFHSWTLLENKYLPHAEVFIQELKLKRQWEDNNPTLLREWKNQWVLDTQSLLIQYTKEKNDYQELPHAHWNYILGVDIGFRDADALALIGWSESFSEIYLIEERVTRNQDISTLTEDIEDFIRRYNPSKIVMDEGGLGKKVAEELRRRRQIPVHPADKIRKMENVAFLNDWLRLGKFKAKTSSKFVEDSYKVQIDWEHSTADKRVVKKNYHSDIIDSVLYAFKESPAFTYQAPSPIPKWGGPGWAEYEADRLEKEAEEHFGKMREQESYSYF